jgi:UDP-4-amino-4,6-dideoxy-N-acetyl-beta-L-altrosamine transaminase
MERLALDGGTPVRKTMLNYARQWVDQDDIEAVVKVLRGDWLTTGPSVKEFENAVSTYIGANEAVAVNTGTAALHAAAFAAGIQFGDEVIVPPITFVASANCVLYLGGKPIFADVCADTLNIDPADIERKITPRTKAIIAVDLTGQPCDHDAIRSLAAQHDLIVIEDAAHALGATYKGRKVGVLQDLTTLSFHPVKHITTAEGGMVLTQDPEMAKRIRSFRHHGIDVDLHKRNMANLWIYDVINLGHNYRIPDINCALGISQLRKLDSWLARRREIAGRYDRAFSSLPQVEIPYVMPDCDPAWHLYIIRLNLDTLRVGRETVYKALRAENIGVNVHYIPIHWLSYYQNLGYQKGECPVAEREYERLITIPLYPAMSDQDVEDVISAVHKVVAHFQV